LKAGSGVRVEAIGTSPIAARGGIWKSQCGDRLLASPSRIAIVCGLAGRIAIVDETAGFSVPGAPIVASAMVGDGTIVVGTESGAVYRVPKGSTTPVPGPELERASIVGGGIASSTQDRFVVVTAANGEASARAYIASTGLLTAGPYALRMPASHVVALWPFAYFGSDRGIYHVDLQTGLLERMQQLDRPIPLAVAAR
jgi:hypothetical protein